MQASGAGSADVAARSSAQAVQDGILRFLTCSPVVDDGGNVYSWCNPAHPGFVYPEAMGLYLTLIAPLAAAREEAALADRVRAVAERLQCLVSPSGGIGLHGHLYPFDTCIAITGLLTYRRHLRGRVSPELLDRMGRFVVDLLQRRRVIADENGDPPDVAPRWSTVFGASMLKTVIALAMLASETGEGGYRTLALDIADGLLRRCYTAGVFRALPQGTAVYCHAHCYALEGLLHLRDRGYRHTAVALRAGADRLQDWQHDDGSLFNWYGTPPRPRQQVGDATAQAVRVWLAVDRQAYQPAIDRGLAFLASLRSPQGGLYYCAGSADVNAITSIFAAQAIEWYLRGRRSNPIA